MYSRVNLRRRIPILTALTLQLPVALQAIDVSAQTNETMDCSLAGEVEPNIDSLVLNESGTAIARLTGARLDLQIVHLPNIPSPRATVVTHPNASIGFRIKGLMDVRTLNIKARTPIDVDSTALQLPAGTRLDAVAYGGRHLYVEKRLTREFAQVLVAEATCAQLGLSASTISAVSLPDHARAYRLDADRLEFYTRPTVEVGIAGILHRNLEGRAVLFFGAPSTSGWLNVLHRGEVNLSAWVRTNALSQLPLGELEDQSPLKSTTRSRPQMMLDGSPRLERAHADLPLRTKAFATSPVVGWIVGGTEYFVIETVAGWESVAPKSLDVMPAPNGNFWVRADDSGA